MSTGPRVLEEDGFRYVQSSLDLNADAINIESNSCRLFLTKNAFPRCDDERDPNVSKIML